MTNVTCALPENRTDIISRCYFAYMLPSEPLVIVLLCVYIMWMPLAMTINGLTLLSLGRSQDLSWQPRFTLLRNLIVCDVLQMTTCCPTVIASLALHRTMSFNTWCLVQYFVGNTCIICSLITITLMVVERYVYICHAIHYLIILTDQRLYLAIGLAWMLSLFMVCTTIGLQSLGQSMPGGATLGLLCEPHIIDRYMGFPRGSVIFRKVTGGMLLLSCIFTYSLCYKHMYKAACSAVEPFGQVNKRACKTVVFYSGMLILQLMPFTLKFALDVFYKLEGPKAMTEPLQTTSITGLSFWASVFHVSLLVLLMVPPTINPLIYGLRNKEVRVALWKALWWMKPERPPYSPDNSWLRFRSRPQERRDTAADNKHGEEMELLEMDVFEQGDKEMEVLEHGEKVMEVLEHGEKEMEVLEHGEKEMEVLEHGEKEMDMLKHGEKEMDVLEQGEKEMEVLEHGEKETPV